MFNDAKAIEFFTNNMVLVRIHAEEDTAISNRYHAKAFPTSILIRKNGEEVDRLVGFDSTDAYLQTFVDFTNGIGTLEDLLGRVGDEVDRSLFLEIGDKYKYSGGTETATNWFNRVIEAGEPLDSLSGEARSAIAYMFRKAKQYDEAIEAFGKIAEEFVDTYHGMDAVTYQGICYKAKGDTASAITTFEAFIEKFPESEEDVEYARGQIERLSNPPEESGE